MLSLVLGTVLAVSSVPAHALAPSARQRSEQLLKEGEVAAAAQRWDEAISKYRASYYGLPPEDQATYVGSLTVRKAMRAYEERIAAEQDPAVRKAQRERQRVMLDEFLAAAAAKAGATEEIGEDVIAELEETRRSIDAALAEPKPEKPDSAQDPSPDEPPPGPKAPTPTTSTPTSADRPEPAPKPERDWLGLGLVIGGSITLAAGLGVGAGRWVLRADALQVVDAGGPDFAPGTDARDDYLEEEYARADKFLIAGAVVAGLGLATAVGGIMYIGLSRRKSNAGRSTALRLTPALSPTTAGLVLHRRF